MAVQAPQSHDQASDPSMHQTNPNPKKVQASNTTISPNDLNHNGLNKNLSPASLPAASSKQKAAGEESSVSAVTEQEQ